MHAPVPPYTKDELQAMPPEFRKRIAAIKESRDLQFKVFRVGQVPCGFFDRESRTCSEYEKRPAVCRDFKLGDLDCLDYRRRAELDDGNGQD